MVCLSYYFDFTDGEIEAQIGIEICLRSYSKEQAGLGFLTPQYSP